MRCRIDPGIPFVLIVLLSWPLGAWAQSVPCTAVFPSTLNNAQQSGRIEFDGGRAINTPNNRLYTANSILGQTFFTRTCGTDNCGITGSIVPDGNYNDFPNGQPNITVNNGETSTRSPGYYNNLNVGPDAYLDISPGIYVFRGDFTVGANSHIRIASPGSVAIFVNGNITLAPGSRTNMSGTDRYLFLYSRGNVLLDAQVIFLINLRHADAKAVIYSRQSVTLRGNSSIEGAVTARGNIVIGSPTLVGNSTVTYDHDAITQGEFGTFCYPESSSHFVGLELNVAGTASTCSPTQVTITAVNANGAPLENYSGTINLTTSTGRGNWSKTPMGGDAVGILNPGASNSGTASYTFDSADGGTVQLQLSNAHAGPVTITATDADAGIAITSSVVEFSDNAFVLNETDALAGDVIAGRNHNYQLQMVRRDTTTGVCGIATGYNRNTIKAWITRAAGDPGGIPPSVAATGATVLPNTLPAADNFTAGFNSGIANIQLRTSDTGRFALNFRDDSGTFASTPIVGAGPPVTVRPFAFHIQVPGNPGATGAGGGPFVPAGARFSAIVRAVAWQAADDLNNDGVADGHNDAVVNNNADLSNNPVTPAFGREQPPEAVRLRAHLVLPAGGVDPGLGSSLTPPADGRLVSNFVNGQGSTDAVLFNEVGIAELRAELADTGYLGSSPLITSRIVGRSGATGRFYADHLQLSAVGIREACETGLDFSYLEQPFTAEYGLSARSALGSPLSNYQGAFARYPVADKSRFYARDILSDTDLESRTQLQAETADWVNGTAAVEGTLTIERAAAPDGPFTQVDISVLPVDGDDATVPADVLNYDGNDDGVDDSVLLGQTELRFGRLLLQDAFGPETANLPVTLRTEYWDGNHWQINVDDSCTELPLTAIAYPDGTLDVPANRQVTLAAGTARGEYADINGTRVKLRHGSAGQYFTPPGLGNTGSFAIETDLALHPWLQFDWSGDGMHNEPRLPPATMTFGVYRSHDRVQYWREVLR